MEKAYFAGGPASPKKAYFGGGCFWCTEAIFEMIRGVSDVTSGYAGGDPPAGGGIPTYEQVSLGNTGHAEVIQITYDAKEVSYKDLLYIFLHTHDPTTKDRQGADVGKQYRSMIFYNSDEEKKLAEDAIKEAQEKYSDPIVTELTKLGKFHKAEAYHQDYYKKNQDATYCRVVIDPKIQKLKKNLAKYLKK